MKTSIRILFLILFAPALSSLAQSESDIVITEIYYNQPGNDTLEFIELHNKGASAINLEGYYFSSGVSLIFPSYSLDAGAYMAVVRYKNFVDDFFNISNTIQWDSGGLDNTGEEIVLKDPLGNIADSVEYNDKFPWPESADGDGPSLELCIPSSDNSTYMTWSTSNRFSGMHLGSLIYASPGRANTNCYAPGDIVPPEVSSSKTTSLSTVTITFSEPVTNPATLENYSGMNVSSVTVQSETEVVVTLSSPISENIRYNLYVHNIQDTAANLMDTTVVHVGYNTSNPKLIITEILYDHPGGDSLEFLEVKYVGSTAAPLGGIYFSSGLTFMFPTMTVQPNQFIILADSPSDIAAFYGATGGLEWEAGSLDNKGEKLLISNSLNDTVFYLQYDTVAPWPAASVVNSSIVTCTENENEVNDGSLWTFHNATAKLPYASPGTQNYCPIDGVKDQATYSIKIYPVPAENHLNIEMEEVSNYLIELADLSGSVHMKTEITNSNALTIDSGTLLKPGIYLLTVQDQNSGIRISKKVVIY